MRRTSAGSAEAHPVTYTSTLSPVPPMCSERIKTSGVWGQRPQGIPGAEGELRRRSMGEADVISKYELPKPNRLQPLSRMLKWHTLHRSEADSTKLAECQRRLQEIRTEFIPFGQRLRELRRALGWTQEMAALTLGISVRTVIRHERGQHRRRCVVGETLPKLRQQEAKWACQLVAHLIRVKRIYPWHPSEQNRLEK